jgi:EAL domain-containing protein (putative c-di-GMP-specific phosphodiesterase class I)
MNIEMIQGYYYGRPMKIKEYEEQYLKPLLPGRVY